MFALRVVRRAAFLPASRSRVDLGVVSGARILARDDFRVVTKMWPNTSLEPTPITPGSYRFGFPVGGSRGRRGSVLGR